MVRVKICGITNREDALAAVEAGADALGFIFVPGTPRAVSVDTARQIAEALPPFISRVGVFVNEDMEQLRWTMSAAGLDYAQLHGNESPEYCSTLWPRAIKAFRIKDEANLESLSCYLAIAYLLDTFAEGIAGGTGKTFDWNLMRQKAAGVPLILAGGLHPGNVAEAIRIARPYAVDVSSGVEAAPGHKDHRIMREFVAVAKGAI